MMGFKECISIIKWHRLCSVRAQCQSIANQPEPQVRGTAGSDTSGQVQRQKYRESGFHPCSVPQLQYSAHIPKQIDSQILCCTMRPAGFPSNQRMVWAIFTPGNTAEIPMGNLDLHHLKRQHRSKQPRTTSFHLGLGLGSGISCLDMAYPTPAFLCPGMPSSHHLPTLPSPCSNLTRLVQPYQSTSVVGFVITQWRKMLYDTFTKPLSWGDGLVMAI